jgi:hypothetical protein
MELFLANSVGGRWSMKIPFRLQPYAFLPCLCSVLLALSACDRGSNSNNASPTPTPKTNAVVVAESESDFQQQPDDENHMRAEVRQAVSETVTAKLPAWTIKGLAIEPYQNNVFWVAADIEKGDKNVVINLVVRKFFPESGNAYWKVILENESLRQQLHNMNDADIRKKLTEAKDEIETLNNPPEIDEGERPDPY